MKKLLIVIASVVFFAGCTVNRGTKQTEAKPQAVNPKYTVDDLFPFSDNVHLKYGGKGNEFAAQDIYVDYVKDNRIQLRIVNGGTTIGQILEKNNGTLSKVYSREEFYYKDDLTNMNSTESEILIKEPIVKGTSWVLPDGRTRKITNVDIEVKTPLGTYKAVEITTESTNKDSSLKSYYAKGIGMIKQVFYSGGIETVSTFLEANERYVPVKQTVKFYYPDVDNDRIVYVKKTINLLTNDEVKSVIEKFLKVRPDAKISPTLPEPSTIEKLYYDKDKNMVVVDLNKDFVKNINAGSSVESMILTSITNTLGDYYNTSRVYITLGGEPYSSGHILIEKDEPLSVNYTNTIEYK